MTLKTDKSKVEEQIDENLKRVYGSALGQTLPNRFIDLIGQLKAADAAGKRTNDAH
jgi:predicted AAA+ superfamily ATPase